MRALFRITHDRTGNLPAMPVVFPDYPAPIVCVADGERVLVMARWGIPSPQFALKGKASDPRVINVRNVASPHWRRWRKSVARRMLRLPVKTADLTISLGNAIGGGQH
jgi:putative SOS response-associated peptidase YedK